ncbi:hypothetical protein INR49_022343 [Caranx melampygus]|nr:hypothetical protein INR49_022343 [Caranx melampygus]
MRHGNDLLTMDAIQDCDVNLKEQGRLIRQDEFTVFFRKKKCVRRVFLFEHLILFSKTKRTDVGNDVYVYKQSFKTSDIGMTHNSGVSGQCFEIWFRRRKSEDTYYLKASSMEVKKAWTTDLEKILGLEYPRPHSIGSGSTASTTLSQSSSSSGRGSLPLAGYPANHLPGVETSPVASSSPEAVTDNELNNHHLHQNHLHPDSTESSGECINFSSSDHSCLSAISGEVVDSSSSFISLSSKPRPHCVRPLPRGAAAYQSLKRNQVPLQGLHIWLIVRVMKL